MFCHQECRTSTGLVDRFRFGSTSLQVHVRNAESDAAASVLASIAAPRNPGHRTAIRPADWWDIAAEAPGTEILPCLGHLTISSSILLIALEVCRVSRAPLSQLQDRYLAKYLDKREDISKDLLLTHLYLLLGCSLPVWLEMSMRHPNPLRSCSGVLLIGVGDSCAALLGIRFGRRRWPNSQRTFMGTAGFLMSISLVVFVLFSTIDHWQSSLLAAALTALLEVYTTSIDNLALPLFFCALHKSMEPWLQWLQG